MQIEGSLRHTRVVDLAFSVMIDHDLSVSLRMSASGELGSDEGQEFSLAISMMHQKHKESC